MTSKGYKPLPEAPTAPRPGGIRSWFRRSHSLEPRPTSPSEKPLLNQDINHVAQWGIHWQTPVSMIGLLLIGIAAGVSHHLFYRYLDGRPAKDIIDQQLATRIGTALAFLVKTTLVAAVGVSRRQLIWYALRRRFITLAGIDGLFGVATDPTHFANLDMFLNAPLSSFMAIVMWTIPLSSIVAPGSLSVALGIVTAINQPCTVPTVRYPFDTNSTAVLQNTTVIKPLVNKPLGTYGAPTHDAIAGYEAMVYGWGELLLEEEFEGCPPTANCSYSLSMVLSGLKCEEGINRVEVSESDLFQNLTNERYQNVTKGTYPVFIAERDWMIPPDQNESEFDLVDAIWIAHVQTAPANSTKYILSATYCFNAIGLFHFDISYYDGYQSFNGIRGPEYIRPLSDSLLLEEGYGSAKYDAAKAVFDGAVGMLEGKIEGLATGETLSTDKTKIRLLTGRESVGDIPMEKLIMIIQQATVKMSIMPMIFPDIEYRAYIQTRCNYTDYVNVYIYNQINLLSAYVFAAFMTLLMAILGFYALAKNGVASDINFSTILLTTRNDDLDELVKGSCLGGNPLPERLGREKMMFGVIKAPTTQEAGHTALGLKQGRNLVKRLVPGQGRYS